MTINPAIFKSYDIRGIYPEQIHERNIGQITKAIYTFFTEKLHKNPLTIVTGRDMRLSGPVLYGLLKQALVESGAHVVDIGLAATPTFYFATANFGYSAGIQLSASHNPPNYNGMKFCINTSGNLLKIGKNTGMDTVKAYAMEGTAVTQSGGMITPISDMLQKEFENAKSIFSTSSIKAHKVVADAANAMGSTYIDELFRHIPGTLVRMNWELDGSFPAHQPDPLVAANLKDLQARVVGEGADLGIAPDGDGDRMFFIDEKGEVVTSSIITSIIAKQLLQTHPKATFLTDINYTMTAKHNIEKRGGVLQISKVGHALITQQIHQSGALFAGESSGHYYFKATGGAESQLLVLIAILRELSESGKKLSELAGEYRHSYQSGEYNFRTEKAPDILATIKKTYYDGKLNELDGVAIEYPDWRLSVRTSNTEPLLRLNLEGLGEAIMTTKRDELIKHITDIGAQLQTQH